MQVSLTSRTAIFVVMAAVAIHTGGARGGPSDATSAHLADRYLERAEKACAEIQDPLKRPEALLRLVNAFADAGRLENAERLALELDGISAKYARIAIAGARGRCAGLGEASAYADRIDDAQERAAAYCNILRQRSRADQLEGWRELREKRLEESSEGERAIAELALALGRAGEYLSSAEVTSSIVTAWRKGWTHCELADIRSRAGDREGAMTELKAAVGIAARFSAADRNARYLRCRIIDSYIALDDPQGARAFADGISDELEQQSLYAQMAKLAIAQGKDTLAGDVLDLVKEPGFRMEILEARAAAEAKSGDKRAALASIASAREIGARAGWPRATQSAFLANVSYFMAYYGDYEELIQSVKALIEADDSEYAQLGELLVRSGREVFADRLAADMTDPSRRFAVLAGAAHGAITKDGKRSQSIPATGPKRAR